MPSKFDQDLIKNLENFTESLEGVVELMKQQAKKGGDATNKAMSALDSERIETIVTDMQTLIESNKEIKNTQDKILEEIKASRKQKESGMFDKIEGKENKSKIKDGIQTVILIAGGVLAIGLAFKLIGQVDFLSVVSLSMGILYVSLAFGEIAKIKELTPMKTAMVGLALITIAGALTISSFILRAFKPLTPIQMFSFVIESMAMGIGAYFIFKAVKTLSIKPGDTWKFLLLPIILPAIAAGLTVSSWFLRMLAPMTIMQGISAVLIGLALAGGAFAVSLILKNLKGKDGTIDINGIGLALLILPGIALGLTISSVFLKNIQPISIMQAISAIAIGIILSVGAFAVMLVLKALKGKDGSIDLKGVGMALLILPSLALGLALSSLAFQLFKPVTNPFGVVLSSLAMGLSILFFLPAVYVLGKMSLKDMATGVLGVLMVVTVMTVSSLIFGLGNFEGKYPSIKWAVSVGLSLIAFTIPVFLLGYVKIDKLLAGTLGVVVVSTAMMISSWIISIGNYDKFPSMKWALGVGLSILLFTPAVLALGIVAMTGIGALAILAGAGMALVVAATIVGTSEILNKGVYDKFPTLDWALGAGLSLVAFGAGMIALGIIPFAGLILDKGAERVKMVAQAITDVSYILGKGNYTGGPTEEWARGVGLAVSAFALAMSASSESSIFSKKIDTNAFGNFIISIGEAMIKVADVLREGKWDGGFPSKEWGEGVSASLTPFINAYEAINKRKSLFSKGDNKSFGELMLGIANAMVQVADVLRTGNWTGGPTSEWTAGVTESITAFVKIMSDNSKSTVKDSKNLLPDLARSMVEVADILGKGTWVGGPSSEWSASVSETLSAFIKIMKDNTIDNVKDSKKLLPNLAQSMVDVANVLRGVDWGEAPKVEWAMGINDTLSAFIKITQDNKITNIDQGSKVLPNLAQSMVDVANVFRGVEWGQVPSTDWVNSVSESLTSFIKIILDNKVKNIPDNKVLANIAQSMVDVADVLSKGNFTGGPDEDWMARTTKLFDVFVNKVPDKNQLRKLQDFIAVIRDFSNAADKLKESGIDKLNKLTASVTIMSVIDDQRLQNVIRVLDTNKDNLSNVIEGQGNSNVDNRKQVTTEVERTTVNVATGGKDKQDSMLDELKTVNKKFDDLLEYVIQSQSPENTGKNETTKT